MCEGEVQIYDHFFLGVVLGVDVVITYVVYFKLTFGSSRYLMCLHRS